MKRHTDAILDSSLFILVVVLFSGSFAGMTVAMIASLVISLYLLKNPPSLPHKKLESLGIDLPTIWEEIKSFDPAKPPSRPK